MGTFTNAGKPSAIQLEEAMRKMAKVDEQLDRGGLSPERERELIGERRILLATLDSAAEQSQ